MFEMSEKDKYVLTFAHLPEANHACAMIFWQTSQVLSQHCSDSPQSFPSMGLEPQFSAGFVGIGLPREK